jgi:proline iminopeptidase
MCRPKELRWFYQHGASEIFPDAFTPYRDHIPEAERENLIAAYYQRLTSEDPSIRLAAAKCWTAWEMATSRLIPDDQYLAKADDAPFAEAFARIECHYFVNHIFMPPDTILANIDAIRHIPGIIVQGRYDVVCPPVSAWELHRAWPESELTIVADAGHSVGEPGIAAALVAATDEFAES